MKKSSFGPTGALLFCASVVAGDGAAAALDKAAVADAYVYLLGRAIPIRQEITDLKEAGVAYNTIKYNPRGSADFVNPNLDVAYLEAWIAVDDDTPVLLEVPKVEGRYYVAQILDEWGEVITNIHGRDYPHTPYGKFALVAPGSRAKVPDDAVRIELNSDKAKLLGRVELKDDPDGAMALQKQFRLTPLGDPRIRPPVAIPVFDNKNLMGVEIFDQVDAIIASAHDISPVAAKMQASARHYAKVARDPAQRKALDAMIRTQVVPEFLDYAVTKSAVYENQWLGSLGTGNYGSDYWMRTSVNLVGLWANANAEVVYYVATVDADGEPLNGSNRYLLEFAAGSRPEAMVEAYWSIILVDVPNYRVVPNMLDRFNFNNYSGLADQPDGALRILVSAEPDASIAPESNWLPAPAGKGFSLTLRLYVPREAVRKGEWFPPALKRVPQDGAGG